MITKMTWTRTLLFIYTFINTFSIINNDVLYLLIHYSLDTPWSYPLSPMSLFVHSQPSFQFTIVDRSSFIDSYKLSHSA